MIALATGRERGVHQGSKSPFDDMIENILQYKFEIPPFLFRGFTTHHILISNHQCL